MRLNFFASFSIGWVLLLLLTFAIFQWLHLPTGSLLDWIIGGASFWWLLVIVTVPWNVHFQAKEVLAEAEQSQEKGIQIDEKRVNYVKALAKRSLLLAIVLHLGSAITFYVLAITGVSAVGYYGSVAALLLTILRPAVRAYEYLYRRLIAIQQQFTYPREDVFELRDRVALLETNLRQIQDQLNPNDPRSWVSTQDHQLAAIRKDITRIGAAVEQFRASNQAEHDQISRESKNAIAQLTTDSQFLDHVREIIRFFKSA